MQTVIHIGAERGELDFYEEIGCENLTYVEPDEACLIKLRKNIELKRQNWKRLKRVKVIPKACSSEGNRTLKFYANGNGQSSLEKPTMLTKVMIGEENSNFQVQEVETINLQEVYEESFKKTAQIDYLCIDTQGHEKSIICTSSPQFLSASFSIIDVEIMTGNSQYEIDRNNWIDVITHLLKSGFTPLIHPHGITESYLFINSKHDKWINNIARPIASSIAKMLTKKLYQTNKNTIKENLDHVYANLDSLGDSYFLPLGITGGAIHMQQLKDFREEFIRRSSLITPTKYDLITS